MSHPPSRSITLPPLEMLKHLASASSFEVSSAEDQISDINLLVLFNSNGHISGWAIFGGGTKGELALALSAIAYKLANEGG